MATTTKDYAQVIKAAFDSTTNAMKSSPIAALVTSAYDSIGVAYPSSTSSLWPSSKQPFLLSPLP